MMFGLDELTAALNNPASPMREKLLQHLSMSPLDPDLAYRELLSGSNPEGGLPPPPTEQAPGFDEMLNPHQDLSRANNPMGIVNLANSNEVMPQPLMPGEMGGVPAAAGGMDAMKGMFEGIGGMNKANTSTTPQPPAVAPKGNSWTNFQATMLQTPAVAKRVSLADILDGGR